MERQMVSSQVKPITIKLDTIYHDWVKIASDTLCIMFSR